MRGIFVEPSTKPIPSPVGAAYSPIVSAELRDQLAGLKDLIDTRAGSIGGIDPLMLPVSDPPTQAEMQSIADKLDDVINALKT